MKTNKYVLLTVGVLYTLVDYNIEDISITYREGPNQYTDTLEKANNTVCVIDLTNSNTLIDECMETLVKLKDATSSSALPKIERDHVKYIIGVLDSNNLIPIKHIERFNKFMNDE